MSFETTRYIHQGNTFVLIKNRRQKHELLRYLQKIYPQQIQERVFHESILTELIQRQTFVSPIYENAMNLLLNITLIHNVPVCFAVPQYTSQQFPFFQQKSKYEPFVWTVPLSIPPSWKKTLFYTPQHTIVIQAELVFPTKQSTDKRPIIFLERVLFDGSPRESMPHTFHIDTLSDLVSHLSRFAFATNGLRFEMKPVDSLRSFDSRKVYDDTYMQTITGFRMYSLKSPITYYHHLAYKSYKANELEPYSLSRVRLLQPANTSHTYTQENTDDSRSMLEHLNTLRPTKDDITIMAVNMKDHHNVYGVYTLYSQSPVKQRGPHTLRLDTFEQHTELCQLGSKQHTIYLTVWFHPYFRKWCLVEREFKKNLASNPRPISSHQSHPVDRRNYTR
jgi:hypothetical protein